nr:unnamed protein product [Digitaria exilis]CAB3451601.1 unnamed protein product [Digitaria exilis]
MSASSGNHEQEGETCEAGYQLLLQPETQ